MESPICFHSYRLFGVGMSPSYFRCSLKNGFFALIASTIETFGVCRLARTTKTPIIFSETWTPACFRVSITPGARISWKVTTAVGSNPCSNILCIALPLWWGYDGQQNDWYTPFVQLLGSIVMVIVIEIDHSGKIRRKEISSLQEVPRPNYLSEY